MLAAGGCRGDGHPPDRQPVHPVQRGSAPVQGSATTQPGSVALPVTAQAAPPGDDQLTKPPANIADHIALKEIAHGLARPVLLVVAPGDARKRLFVVEQRGAIRILEGGTL